MKGFFVILITAFVLAWLGAQARKAKAKHVQGVSSFTVIPGVRILYVAVMLMGLVFMIAGYWGPSADRNVVISGGVIFIVFCAVTWPKTVHVSESGMRQRSWWGGWKTIQWADVLSSRKRRDGCVMIRSRHTRIVLSPYHADQEHFLTQVREHFHRNPNHDGEGPGEPSAL